VAALSPFSDRGRQPIDGGTYGRDDDKKARGRHHPGVKSVLRLVHELNTKETRRLAQQAEPRVATIDDAALPGQSGQGAGRHRPRRWSRRRTAALRPKAYDKLHGGVRLAGRNFVGTKCPPTAQLELPSITGRPRRAPSQRAERK